MASFSDYLELKVLDHVFRNTLYTQPATVYSALFTTAPSDSTGGTEVTQASSAYTRVAMTFATAAAGAIANLTGVFFATFAVSIPNVVGVALMDTVTFGAGNVLAYATITTIAYNTGDQPTVATGAITVTLD